MFGGTEPMRGMSQKRSDVFTLDKITDSVSEALQEAVKSDGGSYIFEIHEDAKHLSELGKAWYSIGNNRTQNHIMLYQIDCNDYDASNNITSDMFYYEVHKICDEIEDRWEELKQ